MSRLGCASAIGCGGGGCISSRGSGCLSRSSSMFSTGLLLHRKPLILRASMFGRRTENGKLNVKREEGGLDLAMCGPSWPFVGPPLSRDPLLRSCFPLSGNAHLHSKASHFTRPRPAECNIGGCRPRCCRARKSIGSYRKKALGVCLRRGCLASNGGPAKPPGLSCRTGTLHAQAVSVRPGPGGRLSRGGEDNSLLARLSRRLCSLPSRTLATIRCPLFRPESPIKI